MTKEEAIENLNFQNEKFFGGQSEALKMAISALSENKGEWIVREDNTSFVKQIPRRWVECLRCGWSFSYDRIRDDFCSKCGADMRGDQDNDKA